MNSRLYVVTGSEWTNGRDVLDVVRDAIVGGADVIQLREKNWSGRQLYETGLLLRQLTREHGVRLIVNDRVDVAYAIQADGVHLGQTDVPIHVARVILGSRGIVGISAHTVEEAIEAEKAGADYIGVGPFRDTITKQDTEPVIGIEGIRSIRDKVSLPIIAIGGIQAEDVDDIITAGANGVAVVRAILAAENVTSTAKDIVDRVQRVRMEQGREIRPWN